MSDLARFILARVAEDQAEALPPGISRIIDNGRILTMFPEVNRVLAECEAIRRIVARHDFDFAAPDGAESSWEEFATCRTCRGDVGEYPCPTLRDLGEIWSDHPDYRQEWRP